MSKFCSSLNAGLWINLDPNPDFLLCEGRSETTKMQGLIAQWDRKERPDSAQTERQGTNGVKPLGLDFNSFAPVCFLRVCSGSRVFDVSCIVSNRQT
jgi:hypothetical protein